MPRRPTGKPKHRPLIPIDWNKVDQMVLAGLSGTQIAGMLDIHHDTFYDRFRIEKGVSFSEYRPSRKEGGDGMVMLKQFQSAMHGNTQMLKLLGEERLGQGKRDNIEGSEARTLIHFAEKIQKLEAALQSRGISLSDLSDEPSLSYQGLAGEENQIRNELGSENIMEREA